MNSINMTFNESAKEKHHFESIYHNNSNQAYECFHPDHLEIISSSTVQRFLILLYSLTTFVALIGNVIVIVVQLKNWKRPRQHLRKYLINLAVADIIFAVFSIPFTYLDFMLGEWIFPDWLCPTTQYVQLLSVFVTANILTLIGTERLTATLFPLSSAHHWLQRNSYCILALIWSIGCFYSYVLTQHTYVKQYMMEDKETIYWECSYDNELSATKKRIFNGTNFVLTFAIPLIVLVCAYSAIACRLFTVQMSQELPHKASNNNNSSCSQPNNSNLNTDTIEMKILNLFKNGHQSCRQQVILRTTSSSDLSKSIKIILVVMSMYCLCWSPIKIYQFLMENGIVRFCTETQYYAQVYIYMACHWLAMASTFVNPLVYSFMSRTFRNDLKNIRSC